MNRMNASKSVYRIRNIMARGNSKKLSVHSAEKLSLRGRERSGVIVDPCRAAKFCDFIDGCGLRAGSLIADFQFFPFSRLTGV